MGKRLTGNGWKSSFKDVERHSLMEKRGWLSDLNCAIKPRQRESFA